MSFSELTVDIDAKEVSKWASRHLLMTKERLVAILAQNRDTILKIAEKDCHGKLARTLLSPFLFEADDAKSPLLKALCRRDWPIIKTFYATFGASPFENLFCVDAGNLVTILMGECSGCVQTSSEEPPKECPYKESSRKEEMLVQFLCTVGGIYFYRRFWQYRANNLSKKCTFWATRASWVKQYTTPIMVEISNDEKLFAIERRTRELKEARYKADLQRVDERAQGFKAVIASARVQLKSLREERKSLKRRFETVPLGSQPQKEGQPFKRRLLMRRVENFRQLQNEEEEEEK